MSLTAKQRYELMLEIIAENGGLGNIDLATEFSKAMSTYNTMRMNRPQMGSPMTPPQVMGSGMPPMAPPTQPPMADPNAIAPEMEAPISSENTPPGM